MSHQISRNNMDYGVHVTCNQVTKFYLNND